jgi:hypothetical protein
MNTTSTVRSTHDRTTGARRDNSWDADAVALLLAWVLVLALICGAVWALS